MRRSLFYLCCMFLLLSCTDKKQEHEAGKAENSATAMNESDEEQRLAALESEMIDFFQSTLEKNYGRRDAVDLLIKGLRKYDYNYILDVDRQRLKEINKKLYGDGWFASYFFNAKEMNDSVLVVPQGMNLEQYRRSAKYKQDLKKINLDSTDAQVTISYKDSLENAKWKSIRSRVENIPFSVIVYPKNGVSYYRKEMLASPHPAMKETVNLIDKVGGNISPEMILMAIESDSYNLLSDFKSDRDVQMFVTLYFWKYLCHSANMNFLTGQDRTEDIMKESGK